MTYFIENIYGGKKKTSFRLLRGQTSKMRPVGRPRLTSGPNIWGNIRLHIEL